LAGFKPWIGDVVAPIVAALRGFKFSPGHGENVCVPNLSGNCDKGNKKEGD